MSVAGQSKLPSNTIFSIFENGNLVEETKIHTACSQPIDKGDTHGSLQITELDKIFDKA